MNIRRTSSKNARRTSSKKYKRTNSKKYKRTRRILKGGYEIKEPIDDNMIKKLLAILKHLIEQNEKNNINYISPKKKKIILLFLIFLTYFYNTDKYFDDDLDKEYVNNDLKPSFIEFLQEILNGHTILDHENLGRIEISFFELDILRTRESIYNQF